jgi:RNA polymerase sigma factor (sigma-70 family)
MKIRHNYTPWSDEVSRLFASVPERKLSDEEEFALGREYATASPERKAEIEKLLLENNMRFVISVAKHYIGTLELEDLIIVGCMGLLDGIRRWDATRGVKLISWSVHHIRKFILEEITRYLRTVRPPTNLEGYIRRLKDDREKIEARYGGLTREALMKEYGLSEYTADILYQYANYFVYSLDTKIREDGVPLYDKIPAAEIEPDGEVFEDEEKILLRQALALLEKKDKKAAEVLQRFYGLDGSPPQSVSHICRELNLSRTAVQQLLRKSHAYIKKYIEENRFRF